MELDVKRYECFNIFHHSLYKKFRSLKKAWQLMNKTWSINKKIRKLIKQSMEPDEKNTGVL